MLHLSPETVQTGWTALYSVVALGLMTPLCLWWERKHP
jgi:hypothetical protein